MNKCINIQIYKPIRLYIEKNEKEDSVGKCKYGN